MKPGLVLLFGMPRSGTTWLGKIFDSHPDTLYRHEPDSGGSLNDIPLFAQVDRCEAYRETLRKFIAALPALNSSRVAGSLPLFAKSYFSAPRFVAQRLAVTATRAAEMLSCELPIPSVNSRSAEQSIVVWKSIESLGRLGLIARVFPECRAILIMRHPCAYIASVVRGESGQNFKDSDPASEDYEVLGWLLAAVPNSPAPPLEVLKKLGPVDRLAWRWVLTNLKAQADIAGAGNCMPVRYEDVCAQPEAKARELLEFAGLSWHPQVADFVKRSTTQHSDRYYSVYKDPLVAANSWQKELSRENIERVMSIVRSTDLCKVYDSGRSG